jgi:Zn-dependent protease with chaperone function
MTAQGAPPAAPGPPERPRPDVLAYPRPTTSRFLVFLAALVSAGAFVGVWLHNELLYDDWFRVVVGCQQQAQQQTTGLPPDQAALARDAAANRCRAAVDRREAAFAVGGAAAAGAAGLVVLYLVPGVVERRRRLRPLPAGLRPAAERVASLAAEAGMAHTPAVVVGDTALRDGFSYGRPGRYRIAMPQAVAVRWRNTALFDPLVRHELAHVAHRDVALAWLARSVWYALAPLLALPLVVGLLSGDLSLLPDYLWRAALLAVTVQLVSSALLRSREHDADLRAAQAGGGPEAVAAVLGRMRDTGAASWYKRLLANHPSKARRLAVLERPELAAGVTFLDGFAAAFLAALTVPLVVANLGRFFRGSGRTDLAMVAAALIAGPLLAGAVGLGLWRVALVQRVVGGPTRPAPVALGVAVGLVLGQVASLAQTATGVTGDVPHPLWLVVLAVAGVGVTVVAAGLGELWADAAPAMRRARSSWLAAFAVNSVLFTAVVWIGSWLETAFGQGGWVLARAWLVTLVANSWLVLIAVAVLAVMVVWAMGASRRGGITPAWLLERGEPQPWPATGRAGLGQAVVAAVCAGLTGAGAIVALRALAGPAASDAAAEQRLYTYFWIAAAAGAAAALALALVNPRRGVGVGALAGPMACLVAVAGFLAMNTALGGRLYTEFVVQVTRPPLGLGLALAVFIAPVGLLAWNGERRKQVWPAAAALGLVAALAVFAGRATLLPRFEDLTSQVLGLDTQSQQQLAVAEAQHYLLRVEPDARERFNAVQAAWQAVNADRSVGGLPQAARLRAEVLAPMQALLADEEAYRPATPDIATVHLALVASLRAGVEGIEAFATALETGDTTAFPVVQAKWEESIGHFQTWESGLADLLASIGAGGTPPPSTSGTNPGTSNASQPTVTTSTTPEPPTELASTAAASASSTAPDSVDDAGNPVSYDATNVMDDNMSTAWRVEGDGRGVTVTLDLPAMVHLTKVGLVPGYAKLDPTTGKDRFPENRRIREALWRFSDGTVLQQRFQDQPTMQRGTVDVIASWITIEIVSTVPGDPDHDYTAISEISLVGTN